MKNLKIKETISLAKLKIYPNPVINDNKVTFQLQLANNELPDATAYIFDITGKMVGTYHLTNYSTEVIVDFISGIYIVKVRTKNGKEFVEKMIIQK